MGSFRRGSNSSNGGRDRESFRGKFRPSFVRGGRGGFSRGDRERPEMFDVTCSKCGKDCQVPFKPTGTKPVFCSDCFRKEESGRDSGKSGRNFEPRREFSKPSAPSVSPEQINQINAKLDKILAVLSELELDVEEDDSEEDSETE